MNEECLKLCEKLIPTTYVQQGAQARNTHENKIRHLLEQVNDVTGVIQLQFWNNDILVWGCSVNGSCQKKSQTSIVICGLCQYNNTNYNTIFLYFGPACSVHVMSVIVIYIYINAGLGDSY